MCVGMCDKSESKDQRYLTLRIHPRKVTFKLVV